MKPEETLDFHIRWAWHRISKQYNQEASKHNASMSHGYILLSIDQTEGTPSTKLGPKMGMEPTSLSRTLKSMEGQGFITRQPDANDKRVVRIFLTEKGKQHRVFARDAVIRFNESVQTRIPKKKLSVFFDVISEINQILDNEDLFEPHEADH